MRTSPSRSEILKMELDQLDHLRSQLKFQHGAYSKLQKEKEEVVKVIFVFMKPLLSSNYLCMEGNWAWL